MNRVIAGIAKMKAQIEGRIDGGLVSEEKIAETSRNLDIPWDEYTTYQQIKSEAVLSGVLTADEGQTIYNYLGESGPDHFNKQPVEVKVVLTKLFSELLAVKIRQRSA